MLSRWKILWMPVVIRCPSSLRVLMMQHNGTTGASFCSMGSLSFGCPHLRCSNQATSNAKSYMELWILRVPNSNHSKSAKRRLVGCIYSCTLRQFFAENHLCQGRSFANNPRCASIIQSRFVNFCKQLLHLQISLNSWAECTTQANSGPHVDDDWGFEHCCASIMVCIVSLQVGIAWIFYWV